MSIPQDLSTTSAAHLEGLIAEKASESAYLEFKRELPGRDDRSKHEFTADVSAFANAGGGDLVYGLDEDGEGQASSIVPLAGNSDEEVRRLQDVLLRGVEPRLPGVRLQAVTVSGGFAVVVRVPQSWAGPHRVTSNRHFFIREGKRKRELDVPEIRSLFLRSGERAQHVRDFRTDRLGRLLAGEAPQRLAPGALMVVHFVPVESALGNVNIDPVPYTAGRYLPLIGTSSSNARLNLDGALAVRTVRTEGTYGYTQLFRNGFLEATQVLGPYDSKPPVLPSLAYEEYLTDLLLKVRKELTHLGVAHDLTCMFSLLRAKGLLLGVDRFRFYLDGDQGVFDRDVVALPDILLPGELEPAVALKPVFDLVWQGAGIERSYNYDEAGRWAPHR